MIEYVFGYAVIFLMILFGYLSFGCGMMIADNRFRKNHGIPSTCNKVHWKFIFLGTFGLYRRYRPKVCMDCFGGFLFD